MLTSGGIKFDYITDPTFTASDLAAWTTCVGSSLEAYEGPDEYDIQHPASDSNWPLTVENYQATLYNAVKNNAASATAAVFGPTFTTENAYQSVGNLSAFETEANMHDGFAGFNPGTAGYGPGGYGSIAYNVALAQIVGPGLPTVATETQYSTAAAVNGVPASVQAEYLPRLYFDFLLGGVGRTFFYELLDEPENTPEESDVGIVTTAYAPKPAYTALASLIALLSDPGSSFNPATLSYATAGMPQDVRHMVLEKRDGSFYLAFWREDEDWDPNAQTGISVSPVQISITLPVAPTAITLYAFDTTDVLVPTTIAPSTSLTLDVTNSVSLVHVVLPNSLAAAVKRIRHSLIHR